MDTLNLETIHNPRKSPMECVGDYNCGFCDDYHSFLVKLPGTGKLVCKSCLAALEGAINAAYQDYFRKDS